MNDFTVLSIDVGFGIVGWSIMKKQVGFKNNIHLIDYGAVITEVNDLLEKRLESIYNQLEVIINKYFPSHLAVEELFYFKNQKTVINVAQARGIIILLGQKYKMKIFGYTPLEVKVAITGYGRADKSQVQKMVKSIFGLEKIPKPDDVADAIAIGFCHINSYRDKNI